MAPHNHRIQAAVGATASQRTQTVCARPPRLMRGVMRLVWNWSLSDAAGRDCSPQSYGEGQ